MMMMKVVKMMMKVVKMMRKMPSGTTGTYRGRRGVA